MAGLFNYLQLALLNLYSWEMPSLGPYSPLIIGMCLSRKVAKLRMHDLQMSHFDGSSDRLLLHASSEFWPLLLPRSLLHSCFYYILSHIFLLCFPLQTSWPPNYFSYLQPRHWTHLLLFLSWIGLNVLPAFLLSYTLIWNGIQVANLHDRCLWVLFLESLALLCFSAL